LYAANAQAKGDGYISDQDAKQRSNYRHQRLIIAQQASGVREWPR